MTNVIEHGQTNWDTVLNQYLDKTTADSEWVKLPLVNTISIPQGSYLTVRTIGPFLAIKAQFSVGSVGEVKVADIPGNVINNEGWRYMTGYVFSNVPVQCLINEKHELIVMSKDANVNQQIDLETVIMVESIDGYLAN